MSKAHKDSLVTKSALRKKLLAERQELTTQQVRSLSLKILTQLRNSVNITNLANVHIFMSVAKLREVDTNPIIDWLSKEHSGLPIYLPRVNPGHKDLEHRLYQSKDSLVVSSWGIPEPSTLCKAILPVELDLILVPLLGFDGRGNRIGYGGGFYDRFLTETRPDCQRIGLSFDLGFQHEPLPTEKHDIGLDAVVTPSKVYRFTGEWSNEK